MVIDGAGVEWYTFILLSLDWFVFTTAIWQTTRAAGVITRRSLCYDLSRTMRRVRPLAVV